jgi:divalent metal cation (Fe/Co/Zn/Cd) transporter
VDLYIILGVGILLKLVLWIYCLRLNASASLSSDTVAALAEDHFNDVLSNGAAIITASIAFNTIAWWVDPVGAILISLVIIYRWGEIIHEQVKKIVGHTAPPEFIQQVLCL